MIELLLDTKGGNRRDSSTEEQHARVKGGRRRARERTQSGVCGATMQSIVCCRQLVAHIQVSQAGARWIPRCSVAAASGRRRCAVRDSVGAFTFSLSGSLCSPMLPHCSPLLPYCSLVLPRCSPVLPLSHFLLFSCYCVLVSLNESVQSACFRC